MTFLERKKGRGGGERGGRGGGGRGEAVGRGTNEGWWEGAGKTNGAFRNGWIQCLNMVWKNRLGVFHSFSFRSLIFFCFVLVSYFLPNPTTKIHISNLFQYFFPQKTKIRRMGLSQSTTSLFIFSPPLSLPPLSLPPLSLPQKKPSKINTKKDKHTHLLPEH